MKAMILAAGRGNRMRPLTDKIPKPLLKVGQFSLIEHLLFSLSRQGFLDVVINLAHLGNKIMTKLGNGHRYGVNILYSPEYTQGGLETGGGILHALPLLGSDPFLVISGDIWTDYDFSVLRKKSLGGLAHLVLVNNPCDNPEGDFYLHGERLMLDKGSRLTFGSIGVYHPALFSGCEPGFFRLGSLLHEAVAQGQVTGEYFQGDWVNVSTPEVLVQLKERLHKTR